MMEEVKPISMDKLIEKIKMIILSHIRAEDELVWNTIHELLLKKSKTRAGEEEICKALFHLYATEKFVDIMTVGGIASGRKSAFGKGSIHVRFYKTREK